MLLKKEEVQGQPNWSHFFQGELCLTGCHPQWHWWAAVALITKNHPELGGPGNTPLFCSCWTAPKQHFQCTAKIPVPLQGLAWWFLSFQSPFFLFLFLIFRLLSNKLLTFWRLLLKQEAWGESWRLQSGYTLGKSHSGSGICVSSAAELLKRSWHQRQNHCLVLLFFSLPFKSLATTAVSHLFQLTSLSP